MPKKKTKKKSAPPAASKKNQKLQILPTPNRLPIAPVRVSARLAARRAKEAFAAQALDAVDDEIQIVEHNSKNTDVAMGVVGTQQHAVLAGTIDALEDDEVPPVHDVRVQEKDLNVTCVAKNGAVVDRFFEDKENYHVYKDELGIWDVMLNQSNVSRNNNKYYLMQLLKHDSVPNNYMVWFRCGRVGSDGKPWPFPESCLETAKERFMEKFFAKTLNDFRELRENKRKKFKTYGHKYTMIEIDYELQTSEKEIKPVKRDIEPCTLQSQVRATSKCCKLFHGE